MTERHMRRTMFAVAIGVGVVAVVYAGYAELSMYISVHHLGDNRTPTLMYYFWTTYFGPPVAAFVGGYAASAMAKRRFAVHALAAGVGVLGWAIAYRGHTWGLTPQPEGNLTMALILPAAMVGALVDLGRRFLMSWADRQVPMPGQAG